MRSLIVVPAHHLSTLLRGPFSPSISLPLRPLSSFARSHSAIASTRMTGDTRADFRPDYTHASGFHSRALASPPAHRAAPPNPDDVESNTTNNTNNTGRSYGATSNSPLTHKRNQSTASFESAAPRYQWLNTHGRGGGTGDEPGVDVRSRRDEEAYGHLKGKTNITVVDYTSESEGKNVRVEFEGERLREWLDSEHGARTLNEEGRPTGVRWIHVNGVNWQVIKTLTLEYGLHPLAVEDALRSTNSPRSKLDFYKNHLYLQILVQHTHTSDEQLLAHVADELNTSSIAKVLSGDVSELEQGEGARQKRDQGRFEPAIQGGTRLMKLPEGVEGVFEPSVDPSRGLKHPMYENSAHRLTVDELSATYMVPIRRGMLSAFMTRDGTLITLMRRPIKEVLNPVYARLEDEQSLLRRSGDVSMLTQALLDISVDLAIEISQTFESEILKLEASVLVNPSMETVRHLHVLSSQLIRLRRSLTPLLHVVYIIRDQDVQRAAAASAVNAGGTASVNGGGSGGGNGGGGGRPNDKNHSSRDTQWLAPPPSPPHHNGNGNIAAGPSGLNGLSRPGTPGSVRSFPQALMTLGAGGGAAGMMGQPGFFSPMTKVYIGDVLDHLEIIVSNMDQYVATCDHLTDYVFNVLSFQTNASMERLSIVTVVFLPLTFIASYFGMNFTGFDELQGPVSYFWKVAAPCTVGFFLIFSFSYLRSGAKTLVRRMAKWRRERLFSKGKGARMRAKGKMH